MIVALIVISLTLNCLCMFAIFLLIKRLALHELAISQLTNVSSDLFMNQQHVVETLSIIQKGVNTNVEINNTVLTGLEKIVQRVNSHKIWNIIKSQN